MKVMFDWEQPYKSKTWSHLDPQGREIASIYEFRNVGWREYRAMYVNGDGFKVLHGFKDIQEAKKTIDEILLKEYKILPNHYRLLK